MIDNGELGGLDVALIKTEEVYGPTLCKAWLQALWAVVTKSEHHEQALAWSNLIMLWRNTESQALLILGELDLDSTLCRRTWSLGQTVPGGTSTRKSGNKQKLREVDCSHVDLTS